ncbi:MAG: hypothetical protein ACOCRO_08110 [Halanaerobiales bacterium]
MSKYWRMQLHPSDSQNAIRYTINSLVAGFIGLDFLEDPGNLTIADPQTVLQSEKQFFAFATDMKVGDKVLIFTHNFPFALVTVKGEYNYIKNQTPELGLWFRHFRRISDDIIYYYDYKTNAHKWQRIPMTSTISPLHDPNSKTYMLIEKMLEEKA